MASHTVGKLVETARKRHKWSLQELGKRVGRSKTNIDFLEKDLHKSGPDPETLIRVARALEAPEILIHHCQTCPIRNEVLLRQYPALNNCKDDPAVLAASMAKEHREAAAAAEQLFELLTKGNYGSDSDKDRFYELMKELVDADRKYEEFIFAILLKTVHTQEDLRRVHEIQQRDMELRGYHDPKKTEEGV